MRPIPNLRWWIAALLAAATALNYLDRQSLPVVIAEIQKDIPISDQAYARLQFLFLLAYGLMYAVGGRIIDAVGTRAGYAIMIVWWSAANLLHGFASSVFELGLFRFLLGVGEGGGFPGSAKAVSEWFPARERAFAFGIFNTGSSVGAVVAPPLIALIVLAADWRWVFFLTGALGFVWAAGWLMLYRLPSEHSLITPGERRYLVEALSSTAALPIPARRGTWLSLFRHREVWGLVIAKFLSDSAWYFFIFWLPKYLGDVRGLDIKEIGYYAWIPYAFAGAGSFMGGWLSSLLVRRQFGIDAARKVSLAMAAACMPASLLIMASPLNLAIVFFGMAMFGHQYWSTIVQTLVADMFPSRVVGSVAGLLGAAGSFGAMLFSLLVGHLLALTGSYQTVFILAGLLHPVSFIVLLVMVRTIRPVMSADAHRR